MSDQAKHTFQLHKPLKRAHLFQNHITRDHLSQTDIAKKYQKSLAYVSNTLRLLRLPEIVQEGLASGTISEGHARALLTLSHKQDIVSLYREILVNNTSVREAEKQARQMKKKNT